ncbi:MAG: FAD-dependent oxidoreductase [Clostridia bacterium]|nr:FAD-dependent oxidoreductase [Clostridia bacterium]
MMNDYGVKVNWCEVKDCFRVITKDSEGKPMDVIMPTGRQAFIDSMEHYVPGSRKNAEELFGLFDEMNEGIDYVSEAGTQADTKILMKKYPNMLRTGAYPTRTVFNAMKMPQKMQDILENYWSYLGVDLEHLAFIHYCSMVSSYVENGAYIPAHTSHEISVAMIERIRELGGDVWFNCREEEIVFNGSKVCGVKTTMGEVACDYVLANINPDIIYGKMVDKKLIPEREKKLSNARNQRYGARMFTAYYGLDCTPEELGIKDYSIFLSSSCDSVKEYKSMQNIDTNDYSIFLCYNIANPEFSPKGTCVCSFTTFNSAEDWNNVKPEEYKDKKIKLAEKMMKNLKDKTGIDIKPHVEEAVTSSPLTFARYLNVPEGSVYGYETTDWDGIFARSMSLDSDYPMMDGLYPIGTSGPRGDGYSSAYACGKIVADIAMSKEGNK